MRTELKRAREKNGKTQDCMAQKANISLKSYQRIESGTQQPSVNIAILIADAIGIESYEDFKKIFAEGGEDGEHQLHE